jgi:hypothetical protein
VSAAFRARWGGAVRRADRVAAPRGDARRRFVATRAGSWLGWWLVVGLGGASVEARAFTAADGISGERLLGYPVLVGRTMNVASTVEALHGWEYLRAEPGAAVVVGRFVFYNQSVWDGNNPAANAADDGAIAPDKTALRPGGRASFAHYTSSPRGLNGIMIDIEGLRGSPAAADFVFRAGNTATPSAWAAGPPPASVSVRRGAGGRGSDRVTLVWGADAVKKQWLQVTVLPTPATGLAQPDVFYFGNALGETGNSVADARVTGADALRVLGNTSASAAISNRFDINRDGRVGAADRLLILGNLAALDPLILLSPTGGAAIHASPPPVGHEFRITDLRRVPSGMRVGWRSTGSRVLIWTAESPGAKEWTMDRIVGAGEAPGSPVEVVLPLESGGTARFYRFEASTDD